MAHVVSRTNGNKRRIATYIRGATRDAKARELAHRIVVAGQTPLEAATALQLTRDQLYKLLAGAHYKRESAALFAVIGPEEKAATVEAVRRLWALVPRAIERTGELLEIGGEPAVALRAANSILDRTGFQRRAEGTAAPVLQLDAAAMAALVEGLRYVQARNVTPTHHQPTLSGLTRTASEPIRAM
jgi:hypothetical protein